MSHKHKYSISPIAAAVSTALVTPAAALAQEAGVVGPAAIDEIIVTARKRTENVQEIPSSVQALSEEMLMELGALNTDDWARFIPSVTYLNFSTAGSNQVIFRGINTGTSNFIATTSAAVYLDEISVTTTSSQPDIRMMDIARVEALAGPQGTLFGAASQSGTLRIITNQPDPSRFESSADLMIRGGDESDMSHSLTGVVNVPLVEDVFAIRIAAQTAEDGGFIDNVLGNTPDTWFSYVAGGVGWTERTEWGTLDNAAVAEKNWNSVDFLNARIAARWNINDEWAATLSYNYQETEAQAGNDYNPFVGDLETIAFAKNWRRDEWDMVSLTIEADFGFTQFVSATSYLDRTEEYSLDGTVYFKYYHAWGCEDRGDPAIYTGYWANPITNRAVYYPQYCIMGPAQSGDVTQQADYIGILQGPSWNDKLSQEFRLSHQGAKIDWLAGLYFEESEDNWDSIWMKPVTDDYQNTQSLVFMEDFYGATFPNAEYAFLSTDRTEWSQTAVFGELNWHINDRWTATIGGRYFEIENDKQYLKYHAGQTVGGGNIGVRQVGWRPGDGGEEIAHSKISEFVPKLALAWNASDDKMLYATYAEGFRTGGTNRSNGRADWSRTVFPQTWKEDVVANTEIGAKTRWADNTVQLNVALFNMDWEDYQIELVDPSGEECVDPALMPPCTTLPWLKVVGNAGDASSTGLAVDFAWIPALQWDVGANAQWLEAELDEDFEVDPRRGRSILKGQRLPNTPKFQGSAWASYSWPVQFVQGGDLVLRGQYSYVGSSDNALVPGGSANPTLTNDSFGIADARLSLISGEGDWQLDFFVNNLTDERAQIWNSTGNFEFPFARTGQYDQYHRIYTNRPRELGLRFFKRWGE